MTGHLQIELTPAAIEAIAEKAAVLVLTQLTTKPSPLSAYLTVTEAAALARCNTQRIYDLRSSGRLSRTGDGTRALVRRDELEAYLNKRGRH